MARRDELEIALLNPREDLTFEYKAWLDLGSNHGKATLAKAVIAMANADGGYIVIGYNEVGAELRSVQSPEGHREITQDLANAAVQRFVSPALHVQLEIVQNAQTGVSHPVIIVPSSATTPVMALRDCDGVLGQTKVYVRKPGPKSEEPRTVEEWRQLLDRCVQRNRTSMLDAIRAIVEGRVNQNEEIPDLTARLATFFNESRTRHDALLDESHLPEDAVARMPMGRYEIGFAFAGAEPAPSRNDLRARISEAHRIKLTGWPKFLAMTRPELAPYPVDGGIEAWLGRPDIEHRLNEDAAHSDFWRITLQGMLYMAVGYAEDSVPNRAAPGEAFDYALPVWRVGEALLFARRLAATYEGVTSIAMKVRWSGLKGRALRTLTGNRSSMSYDRIASVGAVVSSLTATPEQIDDNLPEVVHELIAPLYEAFNFYELPRHHVEQELTNLTGRR